MLRPPTVNLAISDLGQYRNAFLAITSYVHSRKRLQIYNFFLTRCLIIVLDVFNTKKIKWIKNDGMTPVVSSNQDCDY